MATATGEKTAATGSAKPDKPADYSSVVYFHGMGSQRRYEETSNLIDGLDRYIGGRYRRDDAAGYLSGIDAKVEPLRANGPSSEIIGYIETRYAAAPADSHAGKVKFYEVYWAPIMAEQRSPWRVLKWIFSQPLRPFRTLRSPWRERQRLRRASLAAMFESVGRPPETQDADFATLLDLYDRFERSDAQRLFPEGSFSEFRRFVATQLAAEPDRSGRCVGLAVAWRHAYRLREVRNAVILLSMALALLLLGGALLTTALAALRFLVGFAPLAGVLRDWNIPLAANWTTAVSVTGSVVALVFGKFLTDYMGDVESWATYEETDLKHVARDKVIDCSLEVLNHVLSDDACKRVTIVAHSLGTSVAHDALLALNRRNRAGHPDDPVGGPPDLGKIEHVVTMGSPIDKIEYFFESYRSPSHRYRRVIEELRGDIGTAPFSRNGKPHIHWVNFWDEGDAISGALHSPAGSHDFRQRVDNIHVASCLFPSPGASHAGYFTNRTVIETIFAIIYERAASFHALKRLGPRQGYDYAGAFLGPGRHRGERTFYLWMALAMPWFAAASLVAWLLGGAGVAFISLGVAIALLTGLALGYFISALEGQRAPL
jgi:hypothetical protein